jgi:hypothetical protein
MANERRIWWFRDTEPIGCDESLMLIKTLRHDDTR